MCVWYSDRAYYGVLCPGEGYRSATPLSTDYCGTRVNRVMRRRSVLNDLIDTCTGTIEPVTAALTTILVVFFTVVYCDNLINTVDIYQASFQSVSRATQAIFISSFEPLGPVSSDQRTTMVCGFFQAYTGTCERSGID